MSDDSWDHARLIPTSGTDGADEQERRAASALLAVLGGVREFGRALLEPLGAPAGVVEAFIEVSFGRGGQTCSPDGLIRVRQGERTWTALVEVRTGATGLTDQQLEPLLDVAREQGFDAVLAISNETPRAGRSAVVPEPRPDVALHRDTWGRLLAEAVALRERGVADPDQGWVLWELIRYLEHPLSGVIGFADHGSVHVVRRVEIDRPEPAAIVPEPREPVLEVDLRDPQITVLHTVLIAEPAVRRPPTLPSRREVRLVRRLDLDSGEQAAAGHDAGWYQDPQDSGQLRWWDGVGWSERTYPGQPALA
jgi:hypothetical protein